jgi:CubicO group peptidase (beta-lactamase class C family)
MSEVFETFKEEKLFEHKKGTYSYSNIGYITLGAILESVYGGIPYTEIIKSYVLDPAGMKNTFVGGGNTTLYTLKEGKEAEVSEGAFNEIYRAGCAGGYISTSADLLKLALSIHKLMKPATFKKFRAMYPFEKSTDEEIILSHNGSIKGGLANFKAIYDLDIKLKKFSLILNAIR